MQTSHITLNFAVEHSLTDEALASAVSDASNAAVSGLLMATTPDGGYVRLVTAQPSSSAPPAAPADGNPSG